MKVLITNAEYKHTLAIVRSLGKRNVRITAASHIEYSMSFYSKYCKKRIIYSNPENELMFLDSILDAVKKENYDVLLPVGFTVCLIISKYQELFKPYVKIPIANYESMQIASDKNKTIKFAAEKGIAIPETIYPKSIQDVKKVSKSIEYPVVIKASEESGSVKYANSEQELIKSYKEVCNSHKNQIDSGKYPQIQEYIPGEGYGFFAQFNHGEPRAIFAHKRLHEYPPTGGPSTMAKSIFDNKLNDIGIQILKDLNWHGVAMVEFKKDERDNKFKLIEINPKFWGSLDLAIASGIDFPYLATKMCVYGDVQPVFKYDRGVVFKWIFPDIVYAIANKSVKQYVYEIFDTNINNDIMLGDLKPSILQFYFTIRELVSRLKHKNLYYPHGKPRLFK